MKPERKKLASISVAGVAFAALSLVQTATAVNVVGDANAETIISPSNTIIKMTKSGTLTVTEPGEIEILLVGGGGGGGRNGAWPYYGGGGGAGGVIHQTTFPVTAGEWDVTIGAGGEVSENGGMTTAFGLTAWGGGHGATYGGANASSGASGGGGATRRDWGDTSQNVIGAAANPTYINAPYFNLDNSGSNAPYCPEQCSGGGGGAGGPAGAGSKDTSNGTHLSRPGVAYICSITGSEVAYAGGGGGAYWSGTSTTPGRGYNSPGANGLGGGCENYGGGGRAAGDYTKTSPETGGPGVVIVRFTRDVSKETVFEDATGGTVTTCRVGDERYRVHTFSQSGQFTIPHHGHVEVLVVGGGGGGGAKMARSGENSHDGSNMFYGGGGGAGGVVHKRELFITNGVYDIVIGAGGAVGEYGGRTTAFDLTAFGGGRGASGYALTAAGSGASGGGGSQSWWNGAGDVAKGAEPAAISFNSPYFNLGNKGGNAQNDAGTSGGGGGAGGAASGKTGGAAYICSITGVNVAYAGGGSGFAWGVVVVEGSGSGSYGGGGHSNNPGGSGVVIIRYQMPKHGMAVVVR